MQIVIGKEDFKNLSQKTKEEIIKVFLGEDASKIITEEEDYEGIAELTPFLVKRFMESVSDSTKNLLEVFAKNDGRASYSLLLECAGYDDWRKLRGFFSGVTRRVRKIMQDDEICLLEWDEETASRDDDGELVDGEYFMAPTTTQSFKKYFGM